MMKVALMVVLVGCVQYTSSKPDIIAVRNQQTSDIQGQKTDLNKRSLLRRKGRSYREKGGCYHCIESWVDRGGEHSDEEMINDVDKNCYSSIEYHGQQHDPFCSIAKQEPGCYECIADWVRADFRSDDFDADYKIRQDNIEENCFKGSNKPDKGGLHDDRPYRGSNKPPCKHEEQFVAYSSDSLFSS